MVKKENGFLQRLRATFMVEAQEHLGALTRGLAALGKAPHEGQAAIIETVFREAHSLKGAARSVSMAAIEAASHGLETAFAAMKKGDLAPSPALLELAQEVVDAMAEALAAPAPETGAAQGPRLRDAASRVEAAVRSPQSEPTARAIGPLAAAAAGGAPGVAAAETVRITARRLEALLRQSEEMVVAKLVAARRPAELREVAATLASWRREWRRAAADVRAAEKMRDDLPHLGRLVDFCEWSHSFLVTLAGRVTETARAAAADQRALETTVDRFQDDVRRVLLLPFSSLLDAFPRLVRELCRECGKEAELVILGGGVEIDRRILEEMKDPLIHLVRNCIGHGIEEPGERKRRQKPLRATITIAIAHREASTVEIAVSDDGAGMEAPAVREAAVRAGVLSSGDAASLGDREVLALAFESGVSTSSIITSVSGRGLGLAIVREKAERLGGTVSFETRPGAGTTVRVVLPLTLATFRGLFVRVGAHTLALPTASVERAMRVGAESITTVENRETVRLGAELLAVASLATALDVAADPGVREDGVAVQLVVVVSGGKRIALRVDEILHEQEVLLKTLGPQLPRVRNVAGATVLPTGTIVPVLYVPDLLKSAVRAAQRPRSAGEAEAAPANEKSILVVEDSITARALLRNILETAGFAVKVAVDGVDALTTLKTATVDLVVSDVDMPRMGGFDLTAKIRADKRLAELPVVLVTALESREDRERGIDVGANAYIVKSSFDQSNLLEVVRRLI